MFRRRKRDPLPAVEARSPDEAAAVFYLHQALQLHPELAQPETRQVRHIVGVTLCGVALPDYDIIIESKTPGG